MLLCYEIFGEACLHTPHATSVGSLATPRVGGADATDYTLSATARSFVPFYAQRISSAIVMNGAQSILDGIARARRDLDRARSDQPRH